MLSLTNLALASPPASVQLTAYRPAVSFKNSGDVPASITGTLFILDKATGLTVFSSQLSAPLVAPGATATATAANDWVPTSGHTYEVHASLFAGNADTAASAQLTPVQVSAPGATQAATTGVQIPIPTGATSVIVGFADANMHLLEEKEGTKVIQLPFYL